MVQGLSYTLSSSTVVQEFSAVEPEELAGAKEGM
jgi:hypothetical protein